MPPGSSLNSSSFTRQPCLTIDMRDNSVLFPIAPRRHKWPITQCVFIVRVCAGVIGPGIGGLVVLASINAYGFQW